MRLRDLLLPAMTLGFLVVGEAILEIRAHLRGWSTLVVEPLVTLAHEPESISSGVDGWGPTEDFPFASPIVSPDVLTTDPLVLWVGSSSFALGREHSFPHAAADSLRSRGFDDVLVLNQSEPGMNVGHNTRHLEELGETWKPDFAVLYQLINDLHQVARFADNGALSSIDATPSNTSGPPLLDGLYERTTAYELISANFTPWFSDAQIPEPLPARADSVFSQRVRAFVAAARDVGAKPIIATQATSHGPDEDLPRMVRHGMLRWAPNLQPDLYVATVVRWNEIIRKIGDELDVSVLDVDRMMTGTRKYFTNYNHFTDAGSAVVGEALASEIVRHSIPDGTLQ